MNFINLFNKGKLQSIKTIKHVILDECDKYFE